MLSLAAYKKQRNQVKQEREEEKRRKGEASSQPEKNMKGALVRLNRDGSESAIEPLSGEGGEIMPPLKSKILALAQKEQPKRSRQWTGPGSPPESGRGIGPPRWPRARPPRAPR